MADYLREMFITEYFRYRVLLGDFMKNSKDVFLKLSDIFLIPKESIEPLYKVVESERVTDIKTESDFNQFQRELQYFALSGIKNGISKEEQNLILIKGNAIVQLSEIHCMFDAQQTEMVISKSLTCQANHGSVLAMRMAAFLMMEDIFLNENVDQGIKYLTKASSWNDIVSLLYMLYYTQNNKNSIMARLGYLLKKEAYNDVYLYIEQKNGKCKQSHGKEVELLEALFKAGSLKRESYSASYARALYSDVLDYKNKEKLFFSTSKEFATMAGDLPLKLSFSRGLGYDYSVFSELPLKRETELDRIKHSLSNSDLRQQSVYRPLCLVSNSCYLTSLYMDSIKGMARTSNIELIAASELDMRDFEPTKNNLFVRLCNEDKDNIFFICMQGDVSEHVLLEIRSFLKTQSRRKFRISTPNVTLDLSPILPVCFCDEQNEDYIKNFCEIIKLSEVTDDEKPLLIDDILRVKAFDYGVPAIHVQDEVKERLLKLSIDEIETELDVAIRNNRKKGTEISLSQESFNFNNRDSGNNRYGFGGIINENK